MMVTFLHIATFECRAVTLGLFNLIIFKNVACFDGHKLLGCLLYVSDADDSMVKRRDAARKKDSRKDRKDKGYVMFEEEDSEEELVADDAIKYIDCRSALFCL